MFKRSQDKLLKELDLHRFIQNMRLQISALIGLLTPKQLLITDEFSQLLVHEFSPFDYSNSSDDGQDKI